MIISYTDNSKCDINLKPTFISTFYVKETGSLFLRKHCLNVSLNIEEKGHLAMDYIKNKHKNIPLLIHSVS